MDIHKKRWIFINIYPKEWIFMDIHKKKWIFMNIYPKRWIFDGILDYFHKYMDFIMNIHVKSIYFRMDIHEIFDNIYGFWIDIYKIHGIYAKSMDIHAKSAKKKFFF